MHARSTLRRLLGTPPIPAVPFLVAKLALVVLVVAPLLQLGGFPISAPLAGATPVALGLALFGLVILAVASRTLGPSLRVGLPQEETVLQTGGIYRYSRHPIYTSIFFLATAASIYCPHPVVVTAALLALGLHHWIALAEEEFLDRRFGSAWREHKRRVPRYLGLPRH